MDLLDRIAPTTSIPTPAGMALVTQGQFFAFLKQDPRDIMPRNIQPHETSWQTPQQTEVGRSYPGWKNPGDEEAWFLTDAAKATLKS
jgi:hypothetical protein